METIMATTTENNTATDTNFDERCLPFPHAELEAVEKALELLQKAFEKFPDDFWQASECWRVVEKVQRDLDQNMFGAMTRRKHKNMKPRGCCALYSLAITGNTVASPTAVSR
jgi:hypothetical protein